MEGAAFSQHLSNSELCIHDIVRQKFAQKIDWGPYTQIEYSMNRLKVPFDRPKDTVLTMFNPSISF